MRIMLMWPTPENVVEVLLHELKRAGHTIVYWVGENPVAALNPDGSIFHDHYDAWDGVRAPALKDARIPPASHAMISSMCETESLILTMMNKHFDGAPVDERKHIYYTMLAYWDYVLEMTKPDLILYALVPHSVYSNILYDLARKRGIPSVCFEDTWAALRLLPFDDFWSGNARLKEAVDRYMRVPLSPDDIGPELREFYETSRRLRTPPSYMSDQKKLAAGFGLIRHRIRIAVASIMNGTIYRHAQSYVKRSFQKNLRHEYRKFAREPDWNVPFVYFPLSFQPERTTSPQGGIYHDQILAAETIASALPEGWELYVKEHPSQWWLRGKERYSSARYAGYYERIAQIPRVRLVPIEISSFDLTERSKTVATITGTAGWEALVRGKSPIVFGIPWYRDCPGIFQVASEDDCREALVRVAQGAAVSEHDVLAFLKALEENSIRAHLAPPPAGSPHISPHDNMRVIAEYIIEDLSKKK